MGGYFGPLSAVTVFQVLASVPFTEKIKQHACLLTKNTNLLVDIISEMYWVRGAVLAVRTRHDLHWGSGAK
jgi:hypothetical protein